MLNRVLEIAEENRYLSLDRGFIVIKESGIVLGSVPLDDIAVLLISAQSAILTKNVLNALSEKGCITILCGKNYIPENIVMPIASHYHLTKNIKNQISASEPLKKRIWQQIVINKVSNQAEALIYCGKKEDALLIKKIATLVKSGDTDNREAYAAKMYFKALFGNDFIRDRNKEGLNAFLNYGYAIVRAAVARAICANGLFPSLGIHHNNNLNQFCLADDLFEIYRPFVDCLVFRLWNEGETELIPDNKRYFANVLKIKVHINNIDTQLIQSMQYLVSSYVYALEDKNPKLEVPFWKGQEDGITIIE